MDSFFFGCSAPTVGDDSRNANATPRVASGRGFIFGDERSATYGFLSAAGIGRELARRHPVISRSV